MEMHKYSFIGIGIAAIMIFFYLILGLSAMLASLGIILFFIFPFYLILNNFELDQDEKIVFAFFLGAGIFPSITYWLGLIISFRLAIAITFILLIAAAFLISKFFKKKAVSSS